MKSKKAAVIGGIPLQKRHGQNFLRNKHVLMEIILAARLTTTSSVFEIGCGDGVLTRELLHQNVARCWVFEIDPMWADRVESELANKHLTMHCTDFLQVDLDILKEHAPWIVVANLPYHLTFHILKRIHAYRHYIERGVIMIQEEVAQKIVKTRGRGYGYVSLFFQYYFDWKLLIKVTPDSFYPAPKVFSRVLEFTTKRNVTPIKDEARFWKFIKYCFAQPRRTLRNNLIQTAVPLELIPVELFEKRAQELSIEDFLGLWETVGGSFTMDVADDVDQDDLKDLD